MLQFPVQNPVGPPCTSPPRLISPNLQLVTRHLSQRRHHHVVVDGVAARVMSGGRGAFAVLGVGPQPLHGGAQDSARGGVERVGRLGTYVP